MTEGRYKVTDSDCEYLILILSQDVHKKFLVNVIEIILFTRSNRIVFKKVKLFRQFIFKRNDRPAFVYKTSFMQIVGTNFCLSRNILRERCLFTMGTKTSA